MYSMMSRSSCFPRTVLDSTIQRTSPRRMFLLVSISYRRRLLSISATQQLSPQRLLNPRRPHPYPFPFRSLQSRQSPRPQAGTSSPEPSPSMVTISYSTLQRARQRSPILHSSQIRRSLTSSLPRLLSMLLILMASLLARFPMAFLLLPTQKSTPLKISMLQSMSSSSSSTLMSQT